MGVLELLGLEKQRLRGNLHWWCCNRLFSLYQVWYRVGYWAMRFVQLPAEGWSLERKRYRVEANESIDLGVVLLGCSIQMCS